MHQVNEQHQNGAPVYRREKIKTYRRAVKNFWFNVASEDAFLINFLHTKIDWKKDFIRHVLELNIRQAEGIIAEIKDELGAS